MGAQYLADLHRLVDERERVLPLVTTTVDRVLAGRYWALAERLAEQGQAALAAEWFERAAPHGGADWHWQLGERYSDGRGVSPNPERARYWLEAGAPGQQPEHWWRLGERYADHCGVKADSKRAQFWLEKAADSTTPNQRWQLGIRYTKGTGIPKDARRAAHWLESAGEYQTRVNQWGLGERYADGKGVPHDPARAAHWLERAAKGATQAQQWSLGERFADGRGVPQGPEHAAYWLEKAAPIADWQQHRTLGFRFATGRGVPVDQDKAIRWFHEAALKGPSSLWNELTFRYASGQGLPKDEDKAYYFVICRSNRDIWRDLYNQQIDGMTWDDVLDLSAEFCWKVGETIALSSENYQDARIDALPWFVKAAECGYSAEVPMRLQLESLRASRENKDLEDLIQLMHRVQSLASAVNGDAGSYFDSAAEYYAKGLIGEPNPEKAATWFRCALADDAANRTFERFPFGLFRIGERFAEGNGVERDPATADSAFRRFISYSVERSDMHLRIKIADRYLSGAGVPKNIDLAMQIKQKAQSHVRRDLAFESVRSLFFGCVGLLLVRGALSLANWLDWEWLAIFILCVSVVAGTIFSAWFFLSTIGLFFDDTRKIGHEWHRLENWLSVAWLVILYVAWLCFGYWII